MLRRIRRLDDRSGSPSSTAGISKNTNRASSISILSGLGVHDPERALEPPSATSGRLSPAVQNAKRPSKLRNFFGQRPPSELITNHLTEYFPNAEKKVLQRTARHSMMRRRESVASYNQQVSRFSSSTQGSGSGRRSYSPRSSTSTLPPPVPDKQGAYDVAEDLPRMSLSTEDGRSVDLQIDAQHDRANQLLPPIPFPTETLSESMEGITRQRPKSRAMSIASKRMSYMTELRSKRDKSDTASLMTVDEITAEVENRRVSKAYECDDELDGWTKVDTEIENAVPKAIVDDDRGVELEADDTSDEETSEEDETLRDEEEELSLDVDDDGCIRNVQNAKTGRFLKPIISCSHYTNHGF
jgi:mitogen-activated protein kinase kinase kinase